MKIFLAGENGKSKIIPIVHGGESRHWLHEISPDKENGVKNETIFGKPSHVSKIQGGQELAFQALGGIFSNADISCGRNVGKSSKGYKGSRGGYL